MKRLITLFIALISITAFAETQWYKATEYAYKYTNQSWTDWYSCDVNIKFDLTNDLIYIYSNKPQTYAIYDIEKDSYTDSAGGKQVAFNVIDQDYDKGIVRLRVERNGNSQIYVDFANVSWVYNVVRL